MISKQQIFFEVLRAIRMQDGPCCKESGEPLMRYKGRVHPLQIFMCEPFLSQMYKPEFGISENTGNSAYEFRSKLSFNFDHPNYFLLYDLSVVYDIHICGANSQESWERRMEDLADKYYLTYLTREQMGY